MSHQNASVKSIIFALSANFGIAITKTVAAVITGSGAMLAESIHSFADCGNQGLLFLGLKASKKNPDYEHPLGYGKAIYFWSFIVALMLFSMGGLFSIYEGVHKFHSTEEVKSPLIAIVVLSVSLVLEGASLWGCITQINKVKNNQSLWQWVKKYTPKRISGCFWRRCSSPVRIALCACCGYSVLCNGQSGLRLHWQYRYWCVACFYVHFYRS